MKEQEQLQGNSFVTEKIKERPINRRKLLRRTIITAGMAVIFGLIACLTFLLLEPIFNDWLYPKEEPETIIIPEESEETLPQDMIIDEESIWRQEEEAAIDQTIDNLLEEMKLGIQDYRMMYDEIYRVVEEMQNSMVTVTGVRQDVDWLNDTYENRGQTSGLIVADNGRELLILTDRSVLEEAEEIRVTFFDGSEEAAVIKGQDSNTGLMVLAVENEALNVAVTEGVVLATLGNSGDSALIAQPVIALGNPLGNQSSALYGMITSTGTHLNMIDSNYKLLTTDIYGSTQAHGILIDLSGRVLGIINQEYNSEDTANLISAIGITELKKVLERMVNGRSELFLGVYGTDVPEEAHLTLGVPQGAYITGIAMDSPARNEGIQSGDVIVRVGETEIMNFQDLTTAIGESWPGTAQEIVLMRQGQQEYREVSLQITLQEKTLE